MAATSESQGQITTTAKKPVKILRLLPKRHYLLEYPKDIRLMIYEQVLVRTKLYNRRHEPSCPHHSPSARDREQTPFMVDAWDHFDDNQELNCLCCVRDGMALLRTNKQIHDEASAIFFSKNTFSFCDVSDLRFVSELNRQWRVDTVWRLAIWEPVKSNRIVTDYQQYSVLNYFPNLEHVEIPPGMLWRYDSIYQISEYTPKLRTLVMRWLVYDQVSDGSTIIPLCIGIERTWQFAACKVHERHETPAGWSWERRMHPVGCCRKHCEKLDEMKEICHEWWVEEANYRKYTWYPAALSALEARERCHNRDGSYRLKVKVEDDKQEVVRIWGLPCKTTFMRHGEAKEKLRIERKKALQERLKPPAPVLRQQEQEYEEERVAKPCNRHKLEWRREQKRAEELAGLSKGLERLMLHQPGPHGSDFDRRRERKNKLAKSKEEQAKAKKQGRKRLVNNGSVDRNERRGLVCK